MKKILLVVLAVVTAFALASSQAFAISKEYQKKGVKAEQAEKAAEPAKETAPKDKVRISDFPEKGWHKGPYVAANIGLVQVTNDKHIITARPFGNWANMGYGITFGWDITDWIGPMLQMNFSTKTAQVGDSNGGNNGGAAYPSQPAYTFPAGTFPVEQARQYQVDFGLYAKATLPYFTHAAWQPGIVKIIPYAKVGAAVNGVFVNAATNADKSGAFGGGPALGVGGELIIWKGIFVALDFTEYLIFQSSISRTITTTAGPVSFKLTEGGFKPHFSFMGMFGWHF